MASIFTNRSEELETLLLFLPYILIFVFSVFASPFLNGLIDKFVKEEEMLEQYEKEHEEELSQKLSKEQMKIHKENVKKLKTKFVPKFSIWLMCFTFALISILFKFHNLSVTFFAYSFLTLLLIISFHTDFKICIIPDETNLVGAIV